MTLSKRINRYHVEACPAHLDGKCLCGIAEIVATAEKLEARVDDWERRAENGRGIIAPKPNFYWGVAAELRQILGVEPTHAP